MLIKIGWLALAYMVFASIVIPDVDGQASLLQAVIYQLTDGLPLSVGRLF